MAQSSSNKAESRRSLECRAERKIPMEMGQPLIEHPPRKFPYTGLSRDNWQKLLLISFDANGGFQHPGMC